MKLQAKNIDLQLDGNQILKNMSITVDKNELVGLIGPNGAGKTSLLRVLASLQKVDNGELLLDRQAVDSIKRKQLAKYISYLAQGAPAHWPLEVYRLVALGRLPYLNPWSSLSTEDKKIIAQSMALAEIEHLSNRIVSTLSGGERLRVLIARMFATQSNIILADEPIASLDPYHQLHTMELLREHCDRGGSSVVVMHDLNMASRFCHRLVLIHHGAIAFEGEPEFVLQPEKLSQVYGIETQILQTESGMTIIPKSRTSN
ncbi:MAG: ABC-type cobalamin/Fe3+-siderophores transport system ATPase subunit [Oceanicoccus sp.]|jgi:ABC-type cobalamin/Fe3+-siderophores transport system ATPase subunit